MALSVLIRIVGVLLLLGAVRLYITFERQILPLNQRAIVYFGSLITGGIGLSCAFAGDVPIAAYMVLIGSPLILLEVLQLYLSERKQLAKLRMYKVRFRKAQEAGNEDEMIENHALAASCRWNLPRVKEAREENLEDWW